MDVWITREPLYHSDRFGKKVNGHKMGNLITKRSEGDIEIRRMNRSQVRSRRCTNTVVYATLLEIASSNDEGKGKQMNEIQKATKR